MLFLEKITNVKLKKDYTELLFFVDDNDNEEGYNSGSVCALRIDHDSEIFNKTDNKNIIVTELLKIQTIKTISELVEYLNKKGYIYSITKLTSGQQNYNGMIDQSLKVNVDSVYSDFSDETNFDDKDSSISMYDRSKNLENYIDEKFSEPHPEEDELCLDIYSRYQDYIKYMK